MAAETLFDFVKHLFLFSFGFLVSVHAKALEK